jgi:hypothetical protein
MSTPLLRASAAIGHAEAAAHSLREARRVLEALANDSAEPESTLALHKVSEALAATVSAVGLTEAVLSRVTLGIEAKIVEAHSIKPDNAETDDRSESSDSS